jgi:hypothetical protein
VLETNFNIFNLFFFSIVESIPPFALVAWTLALMGPGSPFFSHYLECCFVAGV